ncbi:MAG: glutathione S-transferase family protein [Burkholderiaceae bacterium]|nr:glutathione S-transferase family protein [Burkholderiaceae bacterium]
MAIELYVFPPSPRAFRVVSVANHLDLPYQIRIVDLRKGEQRAPAYAAMNPNMRMPTLKDGDYVLWESDAILQYLALRRPEAGLLPLDERERLNVTRWQLWDMAHWDSSCAIFVFEHVIKPLFLGVHEVDAAAIARGQENFHRAARVLDGQLAHNEFVTGPKLTLADFSIGSAMTMAAMAKYPVQEYRSIERWTHTLEALPAWQRTLQQQAEYMAKG